MVFIHCWKAGSFSVMIAWAGTVALAGSSHSTWQFGRAFCREATPAAVTLVDLIFRALRLRQSFSGDRSATGVLLQFSVDNFIPRSGERSDTCVALRTRALPAASLRAA